MAIVWIPSQMRDLTDGRETVRIPGMTVDQVIEALDRVYPGVRSRLCHHETLRSGLVVAVDDRIARLGLAEPVQESSEVHFIPAIAGG